MLVNSFLKTSDTNQEVIGYLVLYNWFCMNSQRLQHQIQDKDGMGRARVNLHTDALCKRVADTQ